MNGLRFDFGLLIAYIVPGFLSLFLLSPFIPGLENLFDSGNDEKAVITGFIITSLAIVTGMSISLIRDWTIDSTFKLKIPFLSAKHYKKIELENIDYYRLTKQEVLNAYLEARTTERRTHQFYGNTLVLVAFSTPHLFGELQNYSISCRIIFWIIVLAFFLMLYEAARRSYWKFNNAIIKLNSNRN
ncbi:MAG TPA: hypothetical protein VFX02_03715 [Gammaproteobacteria bacterium]|nr:hypothetical protein [Gammaproteobacteria bacterium]